MGRRNVKDVTKQYFVCIIVQALLLMFYKDRVKQVPAGSSLIRKKNKQIQKNRYLSLHFDMQIAERPDSFSALFSLFAGQSEFSKAYFHLRFQGLGMLSSN